MATVLGTIGELHGHKSGKPVYFVAHKSMSTAPDGITTLKLMAGKPYPLPPEFAKRMVEAKHGKIVDAPKEEKATAPKGESVDKAALQAEVIELMKLGKKELDELAVSEGASKDLKEAKALGKEALAEAIAHNRLDPDEDDEEEDDQE